MILEGTAACVVVYPPPPVAVSPVAAERHFEWAVPEDDSGAFDELPEVVDEQRPARNTSSPVGVNLPPLGLERGLMVFTNRFREASEWRSANREGEPDSRPVSFNEEGWVRQLLPDQVAYAELGVVPGADYITIFEGDGELVVEGASNVRTNDVGRIFWTATQARVALQIRRVSPSLPIKNIRIIRANYEGKKAVPKYQDQLLHKLEKFSVIRMVDWQGNMMKSSDWDRRILANYGIQTGPSGAAYEHSLDLANALHADVWLALPWTANEAYVEALAKLVSERLLPSQKLFLEYGTADEQPPAVAWRVLDADPILGAIQYRAQRSTDLFAAMYHHLDPSRLVRVLTVPLERKDVVESLLKQNTVLDGIDVLGVKLLVPSIHEQKVVVEQSSSETDPISVELAQLAMMAELANRYQLGLVAYEFGVQGTGIDIPVEQSLATATAAPSGEEERVPSELLLRLLDRWKQVGGQTVVGEFEAVNTPSVVTFMQTTPRWWIRNAPTKKVTSPSMAFSTEIPTSSLKMSQAPAKPKIYAARWAKWLSLGLSAVAAGVGAERMVAAHDAASHRDEAIARLDGLAGTIRFETTQAIARESEDSRERAQTIGFSALGVASFLVGTALMQWIFEPPRSSHTPTIKQVTERALPEVETRSSIAGGVSP